MADGVSASTKDEYEGAQVACKSCGKIVVVNTDAGEFFHETPVCDWFLKLLEGAEDRGVMDVILISPKNG